jgi:ATP-dependent Clp protease protease subunit
MLRAKQLLDSVKESIIHAYELKTGMSREKLSNMMDAETDMPAQIAVALGFADEILYQSEGDAGKLQLPVVASVFSPQTVLNSLLDKMRHGKLPEPDGVRLPVDPGKFIDKTRRESIITKQIL